MAIRSEDITIDGRDFVRTYSDAGRLIERDGMKYSEAIDPAEVAASRSYTETDEVDPAAATDESAEACVVVAGGTVSTVRAYQLRETIETLATTLDDEAALENVELFPAWEADGEYRSGDRVQFAGVLYKCEKDHSASPTNAPGDSPNWAIVASE